MDQKYWSDRIMLKNMDQYESMTSHISYQYERIDMIHDDNMDEHIGYDVIIYIWMNEMIRSTIEQRNVLNHVIQDK